VSSVPALSSQVAAAPRSDRAAGACRSLLIGRRRRPSGLAPTPFAAAQCPATGPRLAPACKFLLFSGAAKCRSEFRQRFRAAPHKIIVSINGNTIARVPAGDRSLRPSYWTFSEKGAVRRVCTAARAGKEQCLINRVTTENNTPGNRNGWMDAGASDSGRLGGARKKKPCPVRRLGRLGPGRSIVNSCRSLLIGGLRRTEPVRSGGSRGRPDGQSPACRPPSRSTESGGRP